MKRLIPFTLPFRFNLVNSQKPVMNSHQLKILFFILIPLSISLTNSSCQSVTAGDIKKSSQAPTSAAVCDNYAKGTQLALLYHQESAEYRALCFQSYSVAKLRLAACLKKTFSNKPLAVITDLDETALDNSGYYLWLYQNQTTYEKSGWSSWCFSEKADSIAGSVSFFNYANKNKVQIFYITNRDTSLATCTMSNMQRLGFPQLHKDHFLFKHGAGGKQERRNSVMGTYNVVLLLGDNLNDFELIFEKTPNNMRKQGADKLRAKWGEKYIVFPNSLYGEWENAAYNYQQHYNSLQKDSCVNSVLLNR